MASNALVAILNIHNAALDHKRHCDHNCAVSLGGLKRAAELNARTILPDSEAPEAERYINEMPIS